MLSGTPGPSCRRNDVDLDAVLGAEDELVDVAALGVVDAARVDVAEFGEAGDGGLKGFGSVFVIGRGRCRGR